MTKTNRGRQRLTEAKKTNGGRQRTTEANKSLQWQTQSGQKYSICRHRLTEENKALPRRTKTNKGGLRLLKMDKE
jgi:hypothetical protein